MIIRTAGGWGLKDPDDDEAFQMLVGDVQRLSQRSIVTTTEAQDTADAAQAAAEEATASAFAVTLASAVFSGATVLAAGANTVSGYTSSSGTLSGMDTTTGTFTAPATGIYRVDVTAVVTGAFAAGTFQWQANAYRNGSADQSLGAYALGAWNALSTYPGAGSFGGVRSLTSGDLVKVVINNGSTVAATLTDTYFTVTRLA